MKANQNPFKLHCPLLLAAMMSSGFASAVPSVSTPAVVGHKPVVDNVVIDNSTPKVGDVLKVTYDYSDVDGDAKGATRFSWLYNGSPVAGQTSGTYTIPEPNINTNTGLGNACSLRGNIDIEVEVTPVSLRGSPLTGDTKRSAAVSVISTIPNFTFPDTTTRTWADANAFCQAQGLVLPTRAQLQSVFNTYTSGSTNSHMATRYGWPLNGRCGGSTEHYWTSEVSGTGVYWRVYMITGQSFNNTGNGSRYHVTCVR